VNAAELVAHCRTQRQGAPEGDIRSPAVLADVLTLVLDERLSELASRTQPPTGGIYDSLHGRVVPSLPGVPAPDPKDDSMARSLATLIGYVEDLR
jgi:hypothetical protein